MRLDGKAAIVSGGGQGIGRGIVLALAAAGADVAVLDVNRDSAAEVVGEVTAAGRRAVAIGADLTVGAQVEAAVRQVMQTLDRVDILVNNVGGYARTVLAKDVLPFEQITEEEWDQFFALNLKTQFLLARAVVPHFRKQRSGKIVNLASIAGWGIVSGGQPAPGNLVYAVTKAGVIRLTRVLAAELGADNINVNCICPGVVYGAMWEWLAEKKMQYDPATAGMDPKDYFDRYVGSAGPLKRPQVPEDVGNAVVFLASEAARNITGQALNVNGGRLML